jgi:RhtB (resistance to homoserine/threonine) family protein
MIDLWGLLLAYAVFLGALMSPGPDLLVVMTNTLQGRTRDGVLTAAGIATGLVFHMGYCIGGLGLLLVNYQSLYIAVKWLGSLYLLYLGVNSLKSKGTDLHRRAVLRNSAVSVDTHMYQRGFLTNLLNPKAALFFVALFSQILDPSAGIGVLVSFSAICILSAFLWFCFIAYVMNLKAARDVYSKSSIWIDRLFGILFICLAIKIAFF